MRSILTRTVSLMLAFGLFIGCSTPSSTNRLDPVGNNLSQKELESELKKINSSLAESEEQPNPDEYYHKGYLLSELAQKEENPAARSPVYEEMQISLKKAEQIFDHSDLPAGKQKVDELLKVRWSHEHNQGVQIIQTDSSTLGSEEYEHAAAHFNNATIILPDSVVSYKLEAQAYYRSHQYEKAISTLEKARQHIDFLPSVVLEQLAFLYLETNQTQKAVEVYEDAESFSDENLNLIHGLANAYISIDDHQKAIELLDLLVETEPDNIIYAQTRGIELYLWGATKINSIISSPNPRDNITTQTLGKIDSLFIEAENQLKNILSSNSSSPELEQKLAFFYKNSAANYQQLLPFLSGDQADSVYQKVESYLQSSIPLFVSLTQKIPEEKALWRNLHQAYTYLGMNQKAQEVESKVNR